MFERAKALDVIENALDTDPYCHVCGSPTTITDHDGHLVLECAAAESPEGLVARIAAFVLPHTRHEIIDLSEGIAA
jgi:hypothetical protein